MIRGLTVAMIMTVFATPQVVARGAKPVEERAWLALGDSYSSGEGIEDTPASYSETLGKDCRRATGVGTKATAWAAGAYQQVRQDLGLTRIDFVACTGNITDDAQSQIVEARKQAGGREEWDLVTFSFGGNNIRFSEIIKGCLRPEKKSWREFSFGCQVTEDQVRRRIDMLLGRITIEPSEFAGSMVLPQLFDRVSRHVAPGGDVVITGYPNLIEEVDRWSTLRRKVKICSGILARDVAMLRSAGSYLNEQIGRAIADAYRRHQAKGIRFHFVDIAKNPYELDDNPDNRHANCTRDPWLNGIEYDNHQPGRWFYIDRSFHPHQKGHTNTARVIAEFLRGNVTFDDKPPGSTSTPSPQGMTKEAAIHRFEQFLHALGNEDIGVVCEIAAPAAKKAQDQGFGPCESTYGIVFRLISPAQKAALRTATVAPDLVVVQTPSVVRVPVEAVRSSANFTEGDLGSYTLSYLDGNWFITD